MNKEKFKESFLYIISECSGYSHINDGYLKKMFYFIDFDFFELYKKKHIGFEYLKSVNGPEPISWEISIDALYEKGLVEISPHETLGIKYFSKVPVEFEKTTANEFKNMERISRNFKQKSLKQIMYYIQSDLPYLVEGDSKGFIDYTATKNRTNKFKQDL